MEQDRVELSRVLARSFPVGVAVQEPWVRARAGLYPGGHLLAEENEFVQQRARCTEPHLCGSGCVGLEKGR